MEDLEPATRIAFLTGTIIVDSFNDMSRIKERAKEICCMPFKRLNRMEKVDFARLKALSEYILDKIFNLPIEYRIYRNIDEYFFKNSI